jgi:hypothetical protein
MAFEIIIGENRIGELQNELGSKNWPEFMQNDAIVEKYWPNLYTIFSDYQFALLDNNKLVGVGNMIPINWTGDYKDLPESGLDWAMEKAHNDFNKGSVVNLLVGVQILIDSEYKGHGISYEMLKVMKIIAKSKGIKNIALPVRPTIKCSYPLIPMSDYIYWENANGEPFDPWIRVHIKAGGKIVGICEKSMNISGSVSEWEEWTDLKFLSSGDYVIGNALIPIKIDLKNSYGTYIEPNVWILHKVE